MPKKQNTTSTKTTVKPHIEKAYFEILFDKVPEAIVIADNSGKVLQINCEFTKIFGYTPKEAVGADLDRLVAPPSLAGEANRISRMVESGKTFSLETFRQKKSGEVFHVSMIGSPIVSDGKQVASFGIYRDISDRKTADEAFQREKAYLEQLIESAPEAIVLAENNGKILRVNGEFEKMFGYSAKEAAGRLIDDLVAPAGYRQEATSVTQTVSQGEKFSLETLRRRKDGSLLHVSLVGSPIVIGGQQVAVYGIYRDISDRKKAEEAFQLEKSYLEQLIETAAEGIVVLDKKGCITRANNEFSRMFGYAEQEAVGRSIDDLIIPSHLREEGLTLTGTAVGGSKFAAETVRQRKDGTLIHVSIIGSPIIIKGEQAAVYGIYRDISDRKKAEEAFQREKAYLEQLIESAPEAIVLAENDGRVLRVNSEFEKMFGYSAEETTGRLIDDLVAPVGYQEEATSVTHTVSQGEKFSLETVRRRKDGSQLHVSLVGSPIIIDGEQVAVYGIYRDISDRKKAEDELLENRTLLLKTNQSLQQRTRQLEEANSMLEQLSNLDGLTGIPNRRYFEHFFDIEWRRVRREKKWMSVIMIDVDFFKNYNDLHGHLAGDECLKKIANALQVAHRAGDLVARYGGEEFVMVLPNTDRNGALHLAEMMRTRVKDLMIPHGSSKINPCVTISLGIAAHIPDMSTDQLNLLMNADAALYNAKMNGRDRVEMYS